MSATSNKIAEQELSLLDDVELNENDLTEAAKSCFSYHTDILNAFKAYRCRILADKNLSRLSRHEAFSILKNYYTKSKQVLNYMADNKELLSRKLPIIGPVVICGLPRTGTTLLYNLLACDPHCRAPLYRDMCVNPAPPIARSNSIEQERRAAIEKEIIDSITKTTDGTENGFESSHPLFTIEEDFHIFCQSGALNFYLMMFLNDGSDFSVHLSNEMKKDFIYDYHETFLRMLNSVDAPNSHWLLKTYQHLFYLDTLLQHYPNASIIMTHRNINEVLPSLCRMMLNLSEMYFIDVNSPSIREPFIAQYIHFLDKLVECIIKFRTQQSKNNVLDVIYDDLMEQPIPTVRRIYDHFGLKWSDEFEMGMRSWLRDNPQGKRGRHTYSLADFGLTQEDIERRYADYINLFLRSSSSTNK